MIDTIRSSRHRGRIATIVAILATSIAFSFCIMMEAKGALSTAQTLPIKEEKNTVMITTETTQTAMTTLTSTARMITTETTLVQEEEAEEGSATHGSTANETTTPSTPREAATATASNGVEEQQKENNAFVGGGDEMQVATTTNSGISSERDSSVVLPPPAATTSSNMTTKNNDDGDGVRAHHSTTTSSTLTKLLHAPPSSPLAVLRQRTSNTTSIDSTTTTTSDLQKNVNISHVSDDVAVSTTTLNRTKENDPITATDDESSNTTTSTSTSTSSTSTTTTTQEEEEPELKDSSSASFFPTDDWIRHCAETQAQNKSLIVPFPSLMPMYRLGDCIRFCKACTSRGDGRFEGTYNGSIAQDYASLACPPWSSTVLSQEDIAMGGNFTTLKEVLRLREGVEGFDTPDDNEMVIHLRLGDVIEGSQTNVSTMLIKGADPYHPGKWFKTAIKSVYEYLHDIQEAVEMTKSNKIDSGPRRPPLKKVTFVGGSHQLNMYEKSRVYAYCLREAIQKTGIVEEVKMQTEGGNADHDFYYMSHATIFSQSTGGFSRVIGKAVQQYQNGTIIGRSFRRRRR